MKIAIIGSGISGLSAALLLSQKYQITIFEIDKRYGGHANTVQINNGNTTINVDTGFIVFNKLNYPNLISFFNSVCFLGNRVTLTPSPKNFTIVEYGLENSEILGRSALTWPPRLPSLSSAAAAISSAVSSMFSSSKYSIKP